MQRLKDLFWKLLAIALLVVLPGLVLGLMFCGAFISSLCTRERPEKPYAPDDQSNHPDSMG